MNVLGDLLRFSVGCDLGVLPWCVHLIPFNSKSAVRCDKRFAKSWWYLRAVSGAHTRRCTMGMRDLLQIDRLEVYESVLDGAVPGKVRDPTLK